MCKKRTLSILHEKTTPNKGNKCKKGMTLTQQHADLPNQECSSLYEAATS